MAGHRLRDYPYWRDQAPLRDIGEGGPLPENADVVVVGAGYSGLSVALHLARAGRDVVVIDQDRPGEHASTQNFGAVGRTIRHKFTSCKSSHTASIGARICFTNSFMISRWSQKCIRITIGNNQNRKLRPY